MHPPSLGFSFLIPMLTKVRAHPPPPVLKFAMLIQLLGVLRAGSWGRVGSGEPRGILCPRVNYTHGTAQITEPQLLPASC